MEADTDVHEHTTDEELDVLVAKTLTDAGVGLNELRQQAHLGRFQSEKARRAWFVVDGLGKG